MLHDPKFSGSSLPLPLHVARFFLTFGAALAGIAVAAGAFGAHALRARLSPGDLAIFETAVRYQMYHALALLAVAWASTLVPDVAFVRWAGLCFIAGVLIFSGSLYLLVLTDTRWLGAITPIGGVALIGGWICLALAALRLPAGS